MMSQNRFLRFSFFGAVIFTSTIVPVFAQIQAPFQSRLKKILVLDKNQGGFNGHQESRRDLNEALAELAGTHGFQVDIIGQSDPAAVIAAAFTPTSLATYQAVLFSNNDGVHAQVDAISKLNIQSYVENGGTLIAMHAASAFISNWPWFTQSLVQWFYGPHGSNQPKADMAHDPEGMAEGSETRGVFKGLTAPKGFMDSYYSFRSSPRDSQGVTILLTVDEKSFTAPVQGPMGEDHPVVWTKAVGKGKVINNSLGHSWSTNNAYRQNGGYLKNFVYGTLRFAAGDFVGCTDSRYLEYNPDATNSDSSSCLSFNPVSIYQAIGTAGGNPISFVGMGEGRAPLTIDIGEKGNWMMEWKDAGGRIFATQRGSGPAHFNIEIPRQPGIYFLQFKAGRHAEVRRITVL